MKNIAFLAFLIATTLPILVRSQAYSHGDPTAEEQLMLEFINRARSNPAEEGARLMDTQDQAVQGAYSYFQIDKVKTKQAFTTYPQRPPLAFHPDLIEAARNHTRDMDEKNFQGHTSSNGDELGQRYSKVGYASMGMYGENVAAYSESVWHGHCGLNVDWGEENQKVLGHRSNIMNFNNSVYTEIGIGITFNGKGLSQGWVGPYVVTQDFGVRSQRYIVGVVYIDKNRNNFYDIGEGVSGVMVKPSRGTYYATSSTSGGFAIPYSGAGSVTIIASGGGLPANISKTVDLTGENVKVDFVPASAGPGVVTLSKPTNNATNVTPTVLLEWGTSAQADRYVYQVSKDQQFSASGIIAQGEVTVRNASITVPACNTKYFWRVQGKNDVGAGTWSSVFSFTTGGKMPTSSAGTSPKGQTLAGSNDNVSFTWSAAAEATAYHFRVKKAESPFSVVVEDTAVANNYRNVKASDIGSGNFTWEVRPKNACGMSGWSTPLAFTMSVTSVDELEDGGFAALVTPQPVTDQLWISFSCITDEVVSIRVHNLSGQQVVETSVSVAAGRSRISLDATNGLAPGAYTVSLMASSGTAISLPFIKQ
ncbi:MAG: T9SS type A sorting domain-containing protein [Candidatus Kapabacteria bacterium]|nr:T9SS type A sorting domain-containing protein [Candidatus Kapabacteria bacterium]